MNRRTVLTALAAVALVATSCGSDSDSGSADTASPTNPTSAVTESTGATDTTAATDTTGTTDTTAATESTAAAIGGGVGNDPVSFSDADAFMADVDRTGETIKLGVTNDEGASFTVPEMRTGILTAIDYINANGGVNGATIEPVVCISDATPDGAINCANQFVEAGVEVATYGAEINMDAALKIYEDADIAIISDYAYNQTPSDHVWALTSPGGSFDLYTLLALKDLGSKKPAFLPIEAPVFHYHADVFPKWAAQVGLDSLVGPFVDASQGDFTSAVQSVISDGADALVYFGPANGAISIANAAQQLGFDGPLVTTDTSYLTSADEAAVQNSYVVTPRFPSVSAAPAAPPRIQKNLDAYVKAMTDAGHADLIEGYAENQFSTTIDIGTILETIPEGPINFETIKAALSEDRGLPGFDAPDFNCGKASWAEAPSFCRTYQLVLKVERTGDKITMSPAKADNGGFYLDLALNEKSTSL